MASGRHYQVRNGVLVDITPNVVPFYVGLYNTREVLTVSGSWTAPATGWYRLLLIGGGAGGSFGAGVSGGGGGSGERKELFLYITKDTSCSYTIGAAGIGGVRSTNTNATGGGTTSIEINNITYSAEGGYPSITASSSEFRSQGGRCGGSGLTAGFNGNQGAATGSGVPNVPGGNGGGLGGGISPSVTSSDWAATVTQAHGYGAGGYGGMTSGPVLDVNNGGNGYQGCIVIDYFDPSKTA